MCENIRLAPDATSLAFQVKNIKPLPYDVFANISNRPSLFDFYRVKQIHQPFAKGNTFNFKYAPRQYKNHQQNSNFKRHNRAKKHNRNTQLYQELGQPEELNQPIIEDDFNPVEETYTEVELMNTEITLEITPEITTEITTETTTEITTQSKSVVDDTDEDLSSSFDELDDDFDVLDGIQPVHKEYLITEESPVDDTEDDFVYVV